MDLYTFSTPKKDEESGEESAKELTEDEKTFVNLFNHYYTAKANEETQE